MKRKITSVLTIAIGFASVFTALDADAQNLLTTNPSFENGSGPGPNSSFYGEWARLVDENNVTGVTQSAVANNLYREGSSPAAQDGVAYLKAVTPSGQGFDASYKLVAINGQDLTTSLTNGKTYRVSFYYQNTGSHMFKAVVENGSGGGEAGSLAITSPADVTTWTFASFNFTLDNTVLTSGRLKLMFGANGGTTLIDNVKIEDVATLPVTLNSPFSASVANSAIKLSWATASELNNNRFEVLKSTNGADFSVLAVIPAAGKASRYSSQDADPFYGVNYYKLIQYDNNGIATDYGVKAVNFTLNQPVSIIYPNPSKDQFTIKLKAAIQGVLNLKIVSADGKVVQAQSLSAGAGLSNQVVLNKSVTPGLYVVQINGGGLNQNLRLVVE